MAGQQALTWRDTLRQILPPWLSDRPGKSNGFRFLWAMILPIDVLQRQALEGLYAAMPGRGTPTALGMIGYSRGLLRGSAESDDGYASRLRGWLDRWRRAGSMEAIARGIQENYPGSPPRIRVFNRNGVCGTLSTSGVYSKVQGVAWNWDGTSNPERSGFWSEMWIVIYPDRWAHAGTWGDGSLWGTRTGLGHVVSREEYELVVGLINQWKAARSRVRAVIWTTDATLFDPANAGTLPNGTWGQWSAGGNGLRVPSGRNVTTCRYWEQD